MRKYKFNKNLNIKITWKRGKGVTRGMNTKQAKKPDFYCGPYWHK